MSVSERNAQVLADKLDTLANQVETLRAELALTNRQVALLTKDKQESEAEELVRLAASYGSGPTSV